MTPNVCFKKLQHRFNYSASFAKKPFKKGLLRFVAVSSIDNAIKYYDIFQQKKEAGEHDLRIAYVILPDWG